MPRFKSIAQRIRDYFKSKAYIKRLKEENDTKLHR